MQTAYNIRPLNYANRDIRLMEQLCIVNLNFPISYQRFISSEVSWEGAEGMAREVRDEERVGGAWVEGVIF